MRFKVRLEGTRPIIIQSDRMADPLDKMAKELSLLTSRSAKVDKKSDSVQAKIAEIEWLGALYCDDDGKPQIGIPGDNIHRAMRDAATAEKKGETVRREIVIEEDLIPIEHDGPKDLMQMYANDRFVFRKTVVIQKRRTPRTRPRLPTWALEFHARVEGDATLTKDDVKRILERAGKVGIGTWRPRYGHFNVAKFEAVKG